MEKTFTAIYRREGDWWAAFVKEIPGDNTQGRTLEEARENLNDAVGMMLEFNRERAFRPLTANEQSCICSNV